MPCSALSGVALRSSSIQRWSNSMISCCSAETKPASFAVSCSQCRTSGRSACVTTKAGRRLRAYGNSTSLTKLIELVVPSMSVTTARSIAAARHAHVAVAEQTAPAGLVEIDGFDRGQTHFFGLAADDARLGDDAVRGH